MGDIRETAKPGPTFDAESMRAILAGRKTQTRRLLKGLDDTYFGVFNDDEPHPWPQYADECGVWHPWVPPYRVGGVYYARESLCKGPAGSFGNGTPDNECCLYAADGSTVTGPNGCGWSVHWPWKCRVLAPHCMPRWAARVWLRIVDVRVQRLGEITDFDVLAEGVRDWDAKPVRELWADRWAQVNGRGSWERDRHKWTAAYTFKVLRPDG